MKLRIFCALLLFFASSWCRASGFCEPKYQSILEAGLSAQPRITALEGLHSECRGDGRYYYLLADAYTEMGAYERANETLKAGLSLTTNYTRELKFGQAGPMLRQAKLGAAEDLGQSLVSEFPAFPGGYSIMADASLRRRDFVKAASWAEQSVKLLPTGGGYANLIISYYEVGRHSDAVAAFKKGMALDSRNSIVDTDAIISAAYAAAEAGMLEEAAGAVRVRLGRHPEDANNASIRRLISYLDGKGAWR